MSSSVHRLFAAASSLLLAVTAFGQRDLDVVVRDTAGRAVAGAVVTSTTGGKAVTDDNGRAKLTLRDEESGEVRVTALTGAGSALRTGSAIRTHDDRSARLDITLGEGACPADWLPRFGGVSGVSRATGTGLIGTVRSVAVFDDGSGSAIYIAGDFDAAGGVAARTIARWNGKHWEPVIGATFSPSESPSNLALANTLIVWDDGTGPALYAGGGFSTTGRLIKWDGVDWTAVGGLEGGIVYALEIHDDGTGPALYAGGSFDLAGGMPADGIARWNGSVWSGLQNGVNGRVFALKSFFNGFWSELYVGGDFEFGVGLANIVKWTPFGWSPLEFGVSDTVNAIEVFDDGTGPAVYLGGEFRTAFGVTLNRLAKWNGNSIVAVGGGVSTPFFDTGVQPSVNTLAVISDGAGGSRLVVGGDFREAGGMTVNGIAAWDGAAWSTLNEGVNSITTVAKTLDIGEGEFLVVGGGFTDASGVRVSGIASWDTGVWSPFADDGLNDIVAALAVFDDGSGPALYVGGEFSHAGQTPLNSVARWDGSAWEDLDGGISVEFSSSTPMVYALEVFDDGSGEALYATGFFDGAGGVAANSVAKWDGAAWSAVGGGIDGIGRTLAVFNDGTGPALYLGGEFTSAGGQSTSCIARWDGQAWSSLSGGVSHTSTPVGVYALEVFEEGDLPRLFVGGSFTSAGGKPIAALARWDGAAWSAVGQGLAGANTFRTAVFGLGTAEAPETPGEHRLYVGGNFNSAGGEYALNVAAWDGAAWSAIGGGLSRNAYAFASFDDGRGPAIYVAGNFASAYSSTVGEALEVNGVARWDGASWQSLGAGVLQIDTSPLYYPPALALLVAPDPITGREMLVVGGTSPSSPGGDSYLAAWVRCAEGDPCAGDVNGDDIVNFADLNLLLANFGQSGELPGDLNENGIVDSEDLNLLLTHYGNSCR